MISVSLLLSLTLDTTSLRVNFTFKQQFNLASMGLCYVSRDKAAFTSYGPIAVACPTFRPLTTEPRSTQPQGPLSRRSLFLWLIYRAKDSRRSINCLDNLRLRSWNYVRSAPSSLAGSQSPPVSMTPLLSILITLERLVIYAKSLCKTPDPLATQPRSRRFEKEVPCEMAFISSLRSACGPWPSNLSLPYGQMKVRIIWGTSVQLLINHTGSPASIAFATQPPILRPRMEEASDFANAWLGECKAFHNICSSGQESTLPARVLSISGIREVPTIKLIDTNGKKGRYIALSHCWGPINKRPLRTTRSNIDDHHVGIPFAHLPKTFRDAVWFTQAIGIDYIWIDSLAIIQDDEVDWHSEAQNMGAVYRNATLVIAAAGARDSTRGLFVSERPHATTKKIPYIVQGVPQGTFNMARRAPCVISVADSRLNKRAWALQERYLARRIMFFMPYEVSWKCRTSQVSEGGSITELGFVDQNGWLNMLEQYSHKKLTMPQDRLYALRGIVDEMAQARTGKFLYDYGVWEDGLHSQLLWRQEEPTAETDSMGLPSWSWASLGGGKCWLMDTSSKPRYMTKALHIDSNGSLVTTGHLSTRSLTVQRISDNSRYKFVLVDRSMDAKYPVYLIQSSYADSRIIGTATYDRLPVAAVRCFFVASTQNFQHRVWPS
jgi:hypothetical protein